MHLYDSRLDVFIPSATSGQIADILRERFRDRLDQNPSESEVRSWRNSLGAFAEAVTDVGMDDSWIVLEYQLPLSSSRVDCMILGRDEARQHHAVLAEFKQWDRCNLSSVPGAVSIAGADVLHPCAQVRAYREYLQDAHSAFVEGHVQLSSCAYLHNVKSDAKSGFFAPCYAPFLQDSPAFSIHTADELARFVGERTRFGASENLVQSVIRGSYRPSKKLLDHVAECIEGYEPWKLLDEQLVTFNRILAEVEQARASGQKKIIVVVGGPGTGKSVIAVQVLAAAARRGYVVAHATGSKAFTTNLQGIVGRDELFRYTHHYIGTAPNSMDLVICDEAHRLRNHTQFGARILSRRPQLEEIIDASKVAVFLLDGQQSVRVVETGSVDRIQQYGREQGVDVSVHPLSTQFRCAGSESYVRWVDYVLDLADDKSLAWKRNREYDVKIFDSPRELESALADNVAGGNTARVVAGFCWPWSDPEPDGTLIGDVRIGNWARPWNRKPREMWKNKGSKEKAATHPYKIWATERKGFGEVGCIYSAQGFEFDYVGVIFGADLCWDTRSNRWIPNLRENYDRGFKQGLARDPQLAAEKLQHLYRILCTRGMKGTYLYFLDPATRRRFERMMND